MATATFGNAYRVVTQTDPDTVGNLHNSGPWTMTYTEPLNIGDPVSVTDRFGAPLADTTGNLNFSYQGTSSTGEPVMSASSGGAGVRYFLTDDTYTEGEDAPPFDDIPYCFLAGTLIATPSGHVPVESLNIGDLVLTGDGRAIPVKWLGLQTICTRFGIAEHHRPISVAAGALGDKLPVRELRLTANHALLIDGWVLVHAGALVNGTTIRRIPPEELGERFVVYHIETKDHEVVLAEGAPAETFIDNVTRRVFDNYSEFAALYGSTPEPLAELSQPRAMSVRQVPPSVRDRIAAASLALQSAREMAA